MNHTPQVPRLPVWPFVAGDAALLFVAYEIGSSSSGPLVGLPLLAVAACVCLGAILLGLPFVVNYVSRQEERLAAQEETLAERERSLANLAATTSASGEQIGILVASLAGLSESLSKSTRHLEQLPARLQERVNEMKEHLNEVAITENEALAQEVNTLRLSESERLETAVAQTARLVKDLEKLQHEFAAAYSKAKEQLQSLESPALEKQVERALQSLDEKLRALSKIEVRLSVPEPARLEPPPVVPTPALANHGLSVPPIPALHSTPPQEPERLSEENAAPEIAPVTSGEKETVDEPEAPAAESPAEEPAEPKPVSRKPIFKREPETPEFSLDLGDVSAEGEPTSSSISADGQTRLLVTAYIGIGNKLFVRGEGPGLSWEKGVPLHFVSIGKWRWETGEAVANVKLRLYRNDLQPAANHGELLVAPGHQLEVTASF